MSNRMTLYGYTVVEGKIAIKENEAEEVRGIFKKYSEGWLLREIAADLNERNIPFWTDESSWTKNKVSRIIDDERYVGAGEYPPIVSAADFHCAYELKQLKGRKKRKLSDALSYLKNNTKCACCGAVIIRRANWHGSERWVCPNGCISAFVTDADITDGIKTVLQKGNENPNLLYCEDDGGDTALRPHEIERYDLEINRVMESAMPDFDDGKRIILERAAEKFRQCKENTAAAYTEEVILRLRKEAERDEIEEDFLRTVVKDIKIAAEGNIVVQFINGAVVSDNAEDVET